MITILVKTPSVKYMLITCVYKPTTGDLEKLIPLLENVLNRRDIIKREKWILGGFNVDLLKRNLPILTKVNRFLKKKGLRQLIISCTRLTQFGGSCIDWIITDCNFVSKSSILNDLISDHYPIYCICKKVCEKVVREWKNIRLYKRFDQNVIGDLLMEIDWDLYTKGLVINYGEGGATKWEKRGSETFCAPPQDRVKLFAPPLLKSGNLSRLPYNMA